jgi:hypothetical protein
MTIQQLLNQLPNGLHDAQVSRLEVDFILRTACLDLAVWVGDSSGPPAAKDRTRKARLTFSGFLFAVSDPPDSRYDYAAAKPLWIDHDLVSQAPDSWDHSLLAGLPSGSFVSRLFVNNSNSFLYIAATGVALEWLEG